MLISLHNHPPPPPPHTQLHCLQLLYKWRDNVARAEDESTGYVLPNHMLFQIAEIMPREPQGVLACCNPIPNLLRQQVQEVNILVQQARNTPLTQLVSGRSYKSACSYVVNFFVIVVYWIQCQECR